MRPDERCEIHGTQLTVVKHSRHGYQTYCNACRRDRYREKYGLTRVVNPNFCKRGHRKTPWTYVRYNGRSRCLRCQSELRRKRKAA